MGRLLFDRVRGLADGDEGVKKSFEQYGGDVEIMCKVYGLPVPTYEYRFARPRQWKCDMAWITQRVMLEVEGGVRSAGRHVRPMGFVRDIEKYNNATIRGWHLLRCEPADILKRRQWIWDMVQIAFNHNWVHQADVEDA